MVSSQSWTEVTGTDWGHWDRAETELTGGPANPAGPGAPGSPRSPCEGNGVKIEGMGQMRHCQHQSGYRWHWQHRRGQVALTGAPRAPAAPDGPGGPDSPWKRRRGSCGVRVGSAPGIRWGLSRREQRGATPVSPSHRWGQQGRGGQWDRSDPVGTERTLRPPGGALGGHHEDEATQSVPHWPP